MSADTQLRRLAEHLVLPEAPTPELIVDVAIHALAHPPTPSLLPHENMTLTMALSITERGEAVPPNMTTMLLMTIERLIGRRDNEYDPVS